MLSGLAGLLLGLTFPCRAELYTDESPGLKVDPVVVLVLSLGFIFSVVALHSKLSSCPVLPALDRGPDHEANAPDT